MKPKLLMNFLITLNVTYERNEVLWIVKHNERRIVKQKVISSTVSILQPCKLKYIRDKLLILKVFEN